MEGARPYDVGAVRHVFLLFFFYLFALYLDLQWQTCTCAVGLGTLTDLFVSSAGESQHLVQTRSMQLKAT